MAKLLYAACVFLVFLTPSPEQNTMTKYKAVEAYEVQPGILMFPRYAEDGQVCEIGLERRHYSPEIITLYSTISRKEIDAIVDELAPSSERGPKSKSSELVLVVGPGMTTIVEYENVAVKIESAISNNSKKNWSADQVAAVITWKNRKCK